MARSATGSASQVPPGWDKPRADGGADRRSVRRQQRLTTSIGARGDVESGWLDRRVAAADQDRLEVDRDLGDQPRDRGGRENDLEHQARQWHAVRVQPIRILATDVDSDVLERGRRGVYAEDRLKNMTQQRRSRFFTERPERDGVSYEANAELKSLITFKQLNLMHPLPMRGPLDVIFCRNVVIYFDKDTQRELFGRVSQLQRPGDLLFLGHSESLFKVTEDYTLIGKTVYRRGG